MMVNKTAVILVDSGYQEIEFWYPLLRLKESGLKVITAGFEKKRYEGEHGYPVDVDRSVADIALDKVDIVVIPGGVRSPDNMRRHKEIIDFVRKAYENGAYVAAICHGPWIVISAGIAKGKVMTSFYSIKDDVINSGAEYIDQPVVVSGHIITARMPDDLPAFCSTALSALDD